MAETTATTTHITDEELLQRTQQLVADVPAGASMYEFRGEQFDRGLAAVQYPQGLGGLDLDPKSQSIVNDELRSAGRFTSDLLVNPIGIGMGMPTVLTHGSDELKQNLLRPCFTGEELWCQLFSEPSAGSDVAGLATKAELDGDEWIVNGQKVWTSLAHKSRWGMLVARTDPEKPKHRGMTYFVVDMHAPGIEIRPLYQITGVAEFNEVFFTDAKIPDSHRLGERGNGWSVAITTLMNERVALGGGVVPKGSGTIATLVDTWLANQPSESDPAYRHQRDRVADLWIRAECLRLTNMRARANATAGTPGPEGSVGKLLSAELNKTITECVVDLLGAQGMLHPPGYQLTRSDEAAPAGSGSGSGSSSGANSPSSVDYPSLSDAELGQLTTSFLRARANSIEGGTSEIMRNILSERVLGLPKGPQVDKEMPWSEIPR